ncbi:sialate O-acetylesterase [Verrucomicrobiaceae bacterium 227]
MIEFKIAALLLALVSLSPAEPVHYDLVILAGQSNAVGFDARPTELPQNPADKNVLLWWKLGDPPPDTHDSSSNSWLPLTPQPLGNPASKDSAPRQYGNFAQAEDGFGPEIGFARHLLKIDPERKLALLKVAFSGTSIPRDWDPKKRAQKDSCYAALLTEFQRASLAATTKDIVLHPTGFLWVQGESDANAKNAPQYAKNLTALIQAVRVDIQAPKLPALIAVNTHFGAGKNTFMPAIVAAQKQVAQNDPLTTYLDTSSAPTANPAHFNTKGTLQVGQQFAETLIGLKPVQD